MVVRVQKLTNNNINSAGSGPDLQSSERVGASPFCLVLQIWPNMGVCRVNNGSNVRDPSFAVRGVCSAHFPESVIKKL